MCCVTAASLRRMLLLSGPHPQPLTLALLSPAAFFSSTAVGGVLRMKVKLRSCRTRNNTAGQGSSHAAQWSTSAGLLARFLYVLP